MQNFLGLPMHNEPKSESGILNKNKTLIEELLDE